MCTCSLTCTAHCHPDTQTHLRSSWWTADTHATIAHHMPLEEIIEMNLFI